MVKQTATLQKELIALLKKALDEPLEKLDLEDGIVSTGPFQEALDKYGVETTIFNKEKVESHISGGPYETALFALVFDANGLYDYMELPSVQTKIFEWAESNGLYAEHYNSWNIVFGRN